MRSGAASKHLWKQSKEARSTYMPKVGKSPLTILLFLFFFFLQKAQQRSDERETRLDKHAPLECVDSQDAGLRSKPSTGALS